MSLSRRVAHNTIIQIIGKGVSLILGVLAIAMMTRYLGQDGFGRFTTVTVYLQFFGIIVDMGLTLMTMQFLSDPEWERKHIFQNLLGLRLVSAVFFLLLAPILALFFPYDRELKLGILLTTGSFFCIALNQIFIGLFQKELRSEFIAWAEIAGRIMLIAGIGATIFFEKGLLFILLATVLGSGTNLLVNMIAARQFVPVRLGFDVSVWKKILERSWPIALSIFFNLIYFKADTIILSLVRSEREVGLYGAPYRVLEVLITFPFIFIGLVFPILNSAFARGDTTQFRHGVQKTFDVLSIVALPLVVGGVLLAQPLMRFVAGDAFALSAQPLRVLMLAIGIIFLGSFFGHLVVIAQKQKTMIPWYAAVAGIALAGYLLFIPRYSYMGAAWMTVTAEALIAAVSAMVALRALKVRIGLSVFGKSALASLVMLIVLVPLHTFPLALPILAGFASYVAALYILGGLEKDMLRSVLPQP